MLRRSLVSVVLLVPLLLPGAVAQADTSSGSIAGRVTDPDGAAVAGLCVRALSATDSAGPSKQTTTDANGAYVLDGLPADRYSVMFNCYRDPQFLVEYYDNAAMGQKSVRVDLTSGQHVTAIDAQVGPGATLTGTIYGPDGNPEPDVDVWVTDESDFTRVEPALTGTDGIWRVDHVALGHATIQFTARDRTLVPEWYASRYRMPLAEPVLVTADNQTIDGLDAHLLLGGVIQGALTDSVTGVPVDGCQVTPWDTTLNSHMNWGEFRPGPNGTYQVVGLATDDYLVYVGWCADDFYVPQSFGSGDPSSAFHVDAGATHTLNVSMVRGGKVTGRVIDADTGAPLDACMVLVRDGRSTLGAVSSGVGTGGTFTSSGVAPGRHDVSVYGCHEPHERNDIIGGVTVTPGAITNLGDLRVRRPPPAAQPRDLTFTCPPDRIPPASYTDVDRASVHASAIDCATAWGLIQGNGAQFQPEQPLTRGQVASIMIRLIQQTDGPAPPDGPDAFHDDDGTVHEAAINALVALGLMKGLPDGTSGVNAPISRAQFARLAAGVLQYQCETPLTAIQTADFFDDDNGSTHELYINALAYYGVLLGTGLRTFNPSAWIHRDQAASVVTRDLDAISDCGVGWPAAHR